MSEENGLLVSDDDGVYFIPADQLSQFKMTEAAAANIRETVDGDDDVSGFQYIKPGGARPELRAEMRPVRFAFSGPMKPIIISQSQYSDALVK